MGGGRARASARADGAYGAGVLRPNCCVIALCFCLCPGWRLMRLHTLLYWRVMLYPCRRIMECVVRGLGAG